MTTIRLESKDLKSRFKKIAPFMSKEETRYYLCGVYFYYNGAGLLKMVATNGHILCEMDCNVDDLTQTGEVYSIIVPSEAVNHLVKILPSTANTGISIELKGNRLVFDLHDFKYETALVDGTFPDYSKVIPEGNVKVQEGFSAKYLTDVLKALGHQAINISTNEGGWQPHLFTADSEDGIKCVIMPMRG